MLCYFLKLVLFVIRRFLIKILPLVDLIILFPLLISIPLFRLFARIGGRRLRFSRELLKKSGVYPIRNHYYFPLFDDSKLKKSLREERNLPAINLNKSNQIKFLNNLTFSQELINMNLEKAKSTPFDFCIYNESFESGDAEFLYQMVRFFKPNNIIEIGSGESTKIVIKALKNNFIENSIKTKHICIEPYENKWLEDTGVKVIRNLVEDCDSKMFDILGPNDILFIDSSHIIKPQGDVLKEYLEIIPNLKKGVIVHVHDIFTPRDYLDRWIREDVYFWNEQYLLETLISNTDKYEVLASLNYLKHIEFNMLKKVCPYLNKKREPASFYFRIKK